MKKTIPVIISVIVLVILVLSIILMLPSPTANVVREDTITIGALLPLSGKAAVYGQEIQQAIELALEEINEEGGIHGKELVVIYEDDQANPATGTKGMQKLVVIDKVPVVLGSWASGVVLAQAPIAEENDVIVMASAISPKITEAGEHIFRMQPSALEYTSVAAKSLEKQGIRNAAVIHAKTEFAESLKDAFVKDFLGEIIAVESYSDADTDMRSQLLKTKSKNPELVFIAGYQDTVLVIKQMEELGFDSIIMAGTPFESKATLDALGPLAEDVIYPYHYVLGSSPDYEQAYLERWDEPTGGFAPLMYEGTHIIADALKACGEDTQCIKDYLYELEYSGILGGVSFDSKGDPNVPIVMKTVKDGKFVAIE